MFNENSGLVKTWTHLIEEGQYTIDDVPNLSNLREVVESVVKKDGGDNE
jgi:hypothetical protein